MSLPSISVREVRSHNINVKQLLDFVRKHFGVDVSEIIAIAEEYNRNCDRGLIAWIVEWISSETDALAFLVKGLEIMSSLGQVDREMREFLKEYTEDSGRGNICQEVMETREQSMDVRLSRMWERISYLKSRYNECKLRMMEEKKDGLKKIRFILPEPMSAICNGDILSNFISADDLFDDSIPDNITLLANSYEVYRMGLAMWVSSLIKEERGVREEISDLEAREEELQESGYMEASNNVFGYEDFDGYEEVECITRNIQELRSYEQYLGGQLNTCLDDVEVALNNNSFLEIAAIGVKFGKKRVLLNLYLFSILLSSVFGIPLQWFFNGHDNLVIHLGVVMVCFALAITLVLLSTLFKLLKYRVLGVLCGTLLGLWLSLPQSESVYSFPTGEMPPLYSAEMARCFVGWMLGFCVGLFIFWAPSELDSCNCVWKMILINSVIIYVFDSCLTGYIPFFWRSMLGGMIVGIVFLFMLFSVVLTFGIMYSTSFNTILCGCIGPLFTVTIFSYYFSKYTGLLHPSMGAALAGGLTAQYILAKFSSVTVPGIDDYLSNALLVLKRNNQKLLQLRRILRWQLTRLL